MITKQRVHSILSILRQSLALLPSFRLAADDLLATEELDALREENALLRASFHNAGMIATLSKANVAQREEIARLKEALAQAEATSETDKLTGLPNRHGGEPRFEELIRAAQRHNKDVNDPQKKDITVPQTVVVMLIDIDHFKSVNDTFGHLVGDDTLKNVAHQLKETFKRPGEAIMRFGGEELLVAFVCDTDRAMEVTKHQAHKLRKAIQKNCVITAPDKEGNHCEPRIVTASIGVAQLIPTQNHTDIQACRISLFKQADQALYTAKRNGRDCVYMHDGKGSQVLPPSAKSQKAALLSPTNAQPS